MSTFLRTSSGLFLQVGGSCLSVPETPPEPTDEVQIGNQIWKSKNLAIDDGQGGIYTQTVNYGQGDVTEYYYTWDAAVRVAASIQGWHLPTVAEWDALANSLGPASSVGIKLKSTYGWKDDGNGTDDYGFAAFPAGYHNPNGFFMKNSYSDFWTATETSSTQANFRRFKNDSGSMAYSTGSKSKTHHSVRLVKDA